MRSVWPEWELMDELGRGSYGVVYKARRRDLAGTSFAAIKITTIPQDDGEIEALRAEGMTEDQSRTYIESIVRDYASEIQMMGRVRGFTNIVNIEDYRIVPRDGQLRWDIYIRMELLTPLSRWMAEHPMEESDIIDLGIGLCSALEICRESNIVHRDIKPENIFVNSRGDYKLGDFGVSRSLDRRTYNMSRKGTYNYMAPELFNNALQETDIAAAARMDIYSLGLVLYRLCNGGLLPLVPNKALRTSQDYRQALERRMRGEAIPRPSDCSEALGDVILKACAYSPARRFATAAQMRDALAAVKAGDPDARYVDPKPVPPAVSAQAQAAPLEFSDRSHLSTAQGRHDPAREGTPRPSVETRNDAYASEVSDRRHVVSDSEAEPGSEAKSDSGRDSAARALPHGVSDALGRAHSLSLSHSDASQDIPYSRVELDKVAELLKAENLNRPKKRGSRLGVVIAVVLALLIGAGIAAFVLPRLNAKEDNKPASNDSGAVHIDLTGDTVTLDGADSVAYPDLDGGGIDTDGVELSDAP